MPPEYVQLTYGGKTASFAVADTPVDWALDAAPAISLSVPDPMRRLVFDPGQLGDAETDVIARLWGRNWAVSETSREERSVGLTLAHRGPAGMRAYRGKLDAADGVDRPGFASLLYRATRCADKTDALYVPGIIPEADGYKPPTFKAVTKSQDKATQKERDTALAPGFKPGATFKIKGKAADPEQKRILASALSVADDEKAPEAATLALICALIVESLARNLPDGDLDSSGPLQVRAKTARDPQIKVDPRNTEQVCRVFLLKGYAKNFPVGAIPKARKTPTMSPGELAQWCQGSKPNEYQTYLPEARAILAAWTGGGSSGGGGREEDSAFSLGPDEDAWEKFKTLATESNRRAFTTLDAIYWVTDNQLQAARPVAEFYRRAPGVKSLGPWTQDAFRQVDTMPLELICTDLKAWEFAAHPVIIRGEGAGDGVWLVSKWSRGSRRDRHVSVELTRPRPFIPESQLKTKTAGASVTSVRGADGNETGVSAKVTKVTRIVESIDKQNKGYVWGGYSSAGYDCSGLCSKVGNELGIVSGRLTTGPFSTWGEPGEGEVLTFWVHETGVPTGSHMYGTIKSGGKLRKFEAGGGGNAGVPTGWRPASSPIKRPGFLPRHAKGW